MDWNSVINGLLPEFNLIGFILLTIITSVLAQTKRYTSYIACLGLVISAFLAFNLNSVSEHSSILANSFNIDALSINLRIIIYSVTTLIALASIKYLEKLESPAEYYPILLTATLGAGLLSGVNDFIATFVSLETLGLSAILLVSYARLSKNSNEASIKYLLTAAFSTAMFLFTVALIYGLTGETNFDAIRNNLIVLHTQSLISAPLLILISVLLVSSIAFKIAAAPFQSWAPDVYTGSPTSTTLFLSVISKTAGFALAIRIFTSVFNYDGYVISLLAMFAILSIVIGNFVGISQVINKGSLKRMLAYSSIAQSGYLLVALAAFSVESISTIILYLVIYALMNTAAFAIAIYFERLTGSDNIFDLAGFIKIKPLSTFLFSFALINLAGLPLIPAGFIAKFFLFKEAFISSQPFSQFLVIVGLIGSVVALFYYLYTVKIMIVNNESEVLKSIPNEPEAGFDFTKLAAIIAIILLTYFGTVGMNHLINMTQSISAAIMAGL